jgi:hypothetical protein
VLRIAPRPDPRGRTASHGSKKEMALAANCCYAGAHNKISFAALSKMSERAAGMTF